MKYQGIFVDIIDAVSKRGNFNAIYGLQIDLLGQSDEDADNIVLKRSFSEENWSEHVTSPYKHECFRIIIPPPESYTSYEKLLLPFDVITWILFLLNFLFAFQIILIVNFMPKWIQNLIYGENVRMPSLNVVRAFFGIGQTRLPKKYFPRVLLIIFILFCLIFRTAYQGVLFELITADIKKSLPETMKEFSDKNYKISFPYISDPDETLSKWYPIIINADKR